MNQYPPPPPPGQPNQPGYKQQPAPYSGPYCPVVNVPTTSGTAVASLIVGIASWFLCPILGALLAIFLGVSAKSDIARTRQAGTGMATAGIALGAAHLVVYGLVLLVVLLVTAGTCAALRGS